MQCSICRLRLDAESRRTQGRTCRVKRKKQQRVLPHTKRRPFTPRRYPEADTSLWTEALFGAEILILHATPVYYGLGVPRGDGSAVVIIPGFLGTDLYLTELHAWLGRIGYRPYFSGIGINAECPNLLIQRRLNQTIDQALTETGRKIHLIGHSLGGVIARSLAGQRPKDVASVTRSPRPSVVRSRIALYSTLRKQFASRFSKSTAAEYCPIVIPDDAPAISWTRSGARFPTRWSRPRSIRRHDGIVDWRYCMTMNPEVDVEVPGTHIGMAFNPAAYAVVAERLASAQSTE